MIKYIGQLTYNAIERVEKLDKSLVVGRLVACHQPNDNDLLLVNNVINNGKESCYEIYLLHSNDNFKSYTPDLFDCSPYVYNRIGLLKFRTNIKKDYVWLSLIMVGIQYYGKGYGTMMMDYFKNLIKHDTSINNGRNFSLIKGDFNPCGLRAAEDVKKFYLKHGSNYKKLYKWDSISINLDNCEDEK